MGYSCSLMGFQLNCVTLVYFFFFFFFGVLVIIECDPSLTPPPLFWTHVD